MTVANTDRGKKMADDTRLLKVESPESGVRLCTLNRPRALNAISPALLAELHATLAALRDDAECQVVVITGAGRGFCAGLDLMNASETRRDESALSIQSRLQSQETFSGLVAAVRALPQPVIAAINGPAAGAGFALALAAEVRIAAESARFLNGAIRLGLSGAECGMSYLLPRLIGTGAAFDVMLTGRSVDSAEALQMGIVSRVVPDDELIKTTLEMARTIAAHSPFALEMTKRVVWSNVDAPSFEAAIELENRTQVMTGMTEDCREAMLAFAEKREPVFRGRG